MTTSDVVSNASGLESDSFEFQFKIWLKHYPVLVGLVPLRNAYLKLNNVGRLVNYAIVNGRVHRESNWSLSYSKWARIARNKLSFSPEAAELYFSVALQLFGQATISKEALTEHEELKKQNESAHVDVDDIDFHCVEDVEGSSVPLETFAIFLCLQTFGKQYISRRVSFREDEHFPLISTRSGSALANHLGKRRRRSFPNVVDLNTSAIDEGKLIKSFAAGFRYLLEILLAFDDRVSIDWSDYKAVPKSADERISLTVLNRLDFLLEGHFLEKPLADVAKFSQLISKTRLTDSHGRVSLSQIIDCVRSCIGPNPFGLLGRDGTVEDQDNKSYFLHHWPPPQLRLFVIRGYRKRMVMRDSKALFSSVLHIDHCSSAEIYLLSLFQCGTVENCTNSTVFIGAVSGSLRLRLCTNCEVVAACGRLILSDCSRVKVRLLTPNRPLLLGLNNSSVEIGPFNTYHEILPSLFKLSPHLCGFADVRFVNQWNRPLIENGVFSAVESVGAADSCQLQTPDTFLPFLLPLHSNLTTTQVLGEKIQQFLPSDFYRSFRRQLYEIAKLRFRVNTTGSSEQINLLNRKLIGRFRVWLQQTGKKQQIERVLNSSGDC